MSQTSLSSILNQNKLTGDNFVDWKRNLLIVSSFEKHKYVLEKDCPPVPKDNASSEESMAFDNWVNSNEIARCYMMASMNSVLKKKHEDTLMQGKLCTTLRICLAANLYWFVKHCPQYYEL